MKRRRPTLLLVIVGAVLLTLAGGVAAYWGDLRQAALDPKVPFQTYQPPPAPDYARPASWLLRPPNGDVRGVDVFFVGPTTYDGGEDWNAPIDDPQAAQTFHETMAPNYAGPFERVGRIFAPRYRQASLYSLLTLREDARDARRFAYGDISAAFRSYLARDNGGRPFVLVGVEQGGLLASRLLAEEIALRPDLRRRLVAAYLVEAVMPADQTPTPPCAQKGQTGCVAAWISAPANDEERARTLLDRALVWNSRGELVNLGGRQALCFNPILGAATGAEASPRMHLGAANATGLERGARPAFLSRQVSAQCIGGVLRYGKPKSASLTRSGSWADRKKIPGYNLFYADIEADALARIAAINPRP